MSMVMYMIASMAVSASMLTVVCLTRNHGFSDTWLWKSLRFRMISTMTGILVTALTSVPMTALTDFLITVKVTGRAV